MVTKLLQEPIERVRGPSDEEQEAVAAAVMLETASADVPVVRLDDETRAAIHNGVAQAERGEFVPDGVVAAANKRHGL